MQRNATECNIQKNEIRHPVPQVGHTRQTCAGPSVGHQPAPVRQGPRFLRSNPPTDPGCNTLQQNATSRKSEFASRDDSSAVLRRPELIDCTRRSKSTSLGCAATCGTRAMGRRRLDMRVSVDNYKTC